MAIIPILQEFPTLWICIVVIFALPVGSFLNVLIYRYPKMLFAEWKSDYHEFFGLKDDTTDEEKKLNLWFPLSRCPKCQNSLKPWHNIPVLSYLILKGRCAFCSDKISFRYPFVELLTAVLTAIVANHFGVTWAMLCASIFTWGLITLAFIDLDHMLLPDELIFPLLWLGIFCNIFGWYTDLQTAVIGTMVGYLSLWSIMHLYKLMTGKQGMGHGDFKLMALFGAWMGWEILPFIIVAASLVGAIFGIIALKRQNKDKATPLPFGPYLVIAGWIALLWGKPIIEMYMDHFYYV